MGILEQWKGRYNRFVFGLLDDDFNLDDTDALYRVRNTKTRGINQALNVIGENWDCHSVSHSMSDATPLLS